MRTAPQSDVTACGAFLTSSAMRTTAWMKRAVTAAAILAVATAALAPAAGAASSGVESVHARVAIQTLTTDATTVLPDDFESVIGYTPRVVDGFLANPDGDCSSPVTLPVEFDSACKAHDLGYDVLRYADRAGEPLGAWARQAIDAQLSTRMHDACGSRTDSVARAGCLAMADIAIGFVDANSWRQGYVSPGPEPVGIYCAAALFVGLLILGTNLIHWRRRA
jgi:hypothetical protein